MQLYDFGCLIFIKAEIQKPDDQTEWIFFENCIVEKLNVTRK